MIVTPSGLVNDIQSRVHVGSCLATQYSFLLQRFLDRFTLSPFTTSAVLHLSFVYCFSLFFAAALAVICNVMGASSHFMYSSTNRRQLDEAKSSSFSRPRTSSLVLA